jgi:hypothetical protein
VWDRGWCLDIWFDSVCANVEQENTGLCFVVPTEDYASRDVINRRGEEFVFCTVIRDKNEQHDRIARQTDNHRSLALARNAILKQVEEVGPKFYLSWDSDLLVMPGTVGLLRTHDESVQTIWTWLNRQPPKRGRHWVEEENRTIEVEWQEPMAATAMAWEAPQRAVHFDGKDWDKYARGHWRCDVALAFQLMKREAYSVASYAPHPHGEDIPFNWALEQRGIPRYCYGEQPGVHLFTRDHALEEVKLGYPEIMKLADQKPLAAVRTEPRPEAYEAIGLFPLETTGA